MRLINVEFSATSTLFLLNIQIFWYEPIIEMLYNQKINQKVLSRSIRDTQILCYFSDANTMIFKHCILNC